MKTVHGIALLVLIAVYLLTSGCSSSLQTIAESPVIETEIDSLDQELLEAITEIKLAEDSLPSCADVDSLLREAIAACKKEHYVHADSLLKAANDQIAAACDAVIDNQQLDPGALSEEAARIYSELMPAAYLDSIPENLAVMVFRRQLAQSLDSLVLAPEDSALMVNIDCPGAAPYNLPIPRNERVTRALIVTARKNKRYLAQWLARANQYLPAMRQVFADSGLPTDLAYLPLIESGFNPRAYSHAHASGIWQFISSTGRRYGLRNNFWFDERRDPMKSTSAAAGYLKKLYGDFSDWHLALAAYNCGEGRVGRAIRKADTADYWHIRLPRETMNYVPQFLAAVMIAKNPHCFGITVPPYQPFDLDTVKVSDCIDLNTISSALKVDFDDLKQINPHILRWCTPPDLADVNLYLPKGNAESFKAFYAGLTPEDKVKWYRYRIRSGDNLSGIARRFKLPVAAIKSINKLSSSRIIAGKHLFIPIPVSAAEEDAKSVRTANKSEPAQSPEKPEGKEIVYTTRRGDTVSEIANRFAVSVRDVCRWNALRKPSDLRAGQKITVYSTIAATKSGGLANSDTREKSAPPGVRKTCTVQKGDNLFAISRRIGVATEQLAAWNEKNIQSPLIYPGETLVYYEDENEQKPGREQKPPVQKKAKADCDNCVRYRVALGDNPYSLSRLFDVDVDTILSLNGLRRGELIHVGDTLLIPRVRHARLETASTPSTAKTVLYQVRKGDNLWQIANLFGISVDQLYQANDLHKQSVLMPGDTLRVVMMEEM